MEKFINFLMGIGWLSVPIIYLLSIIFCLLIAKAMIVLNDGRNSEVYWNMSLVPVANSYLMLFGITKVSLLIFFGTFCTLFKCIRSYLKKKIFY